MTMPPSPPCDRCGQPVVEAHYPDGRCPQRSRGARKAVTVIRAGVAVAAVGLVTATLTGAPGRRPTLAKASAEPAAGPTAWQLAHGRWLRMPPSPLKMCGNLAAWDGRELVVIQEPADGCPVGAAAYDPRANRWTTIAAPPLLKHQWAVAASGGGQVLLVVNSGATYSWRPTTGRWQPLGSLPAGRNSFSVAWTGRTFLVTRQYAWKHAGPVQAFELASRRWKPLPDLPQPPTGRIMGAPPIAFHGAIYVFPHVVVEHHTGQNAFYYSGYNEALRLTSAGWRQVRIGPGGPPGGLNLALVRGAILATGSSCQWECTAETGRAALLRPGSASSVIPLRPEPGVPDSSNFAAGARAIVATYTQGIGGLPGFPQPPTGTCFVYDVATGKWQPGPTAPATPRIAGPAYWTRYGVVTLGETFGGKVPALAHIGGWLLRPAGPRAARR
jgi:hypothetical protein